jgi:hypothetical protein
MRHVSLLVLINGGRDPEKKFYNTIHEQGTFNDDLKKGFGQKLDLTRYIYDLIYFFFHVRNLKNDYPRFSHNLTGTLYCIS